MHLPVRRAYLLLKRGLQRLRDDPYAYLLTRRRKPRNIGHIQSFQDTLDALIQPVLREKIAIRLRRGGKAARHAHAELCELADHLAQRSVLAAHSRHVADAQIFESDDVGLRHCSLLKAVGRLG